MATFKFDKSEHDTINVDPNTSRKLKAAHAAWRELSEKTKAARLEMEAIKTEELRAKGMCPANMEPIYFHKFGWQVVTDKAGNLIVQPPRAASSKGRKATI